MGIGRLRSHSGALAVLAWLSGACSTQPEFDLIVRGGTVYDGTGEPAGVRRADVGIKGDRILAIGDLTTRSTQDVIDATGKVVAPGFIDVASRSGVSLLADGVGESHLRQGITSEILGDNSAAFWTPATADAAALLRTGVSLDWSGLNGYFAKLESRGTAINVGTLVPLSLTRAAGDRTAFIDTAMRDGAFGVIDDVNADAAELTPAAMVAGRYDGVVMVRVESPIATDDAALVAVGSQAHRVVIGGSSACAPATRYSRSFAASSVRAAEGEPSGCGVGVMTPMPGAPDRIASRPAP